MPAVYRKRRRATTWEEVRDPWNLELPERRRALPALDEPPREMLYVWRSSHDDDTLIADADTGETFYVPPNQVAHNAMWGRHDYELLRVQFWAGQPVWIWGPA